MITQKNTNTNNDLFSTELKKTDMNRHAGEQSAKKSPLLSNEEAAEKISRLMVSANQTFMLDLSRTLKQMGLSYPKYHLLGYLENHEPIMKNIADKMGMTVAAATGTVDSLEKIGLVGRVHDLEDRRRVSVTITAEGRKTLEDIRLTIQSLIAAAMTARDEGRNEDAQIICDELRPLVGGA